MRKRAGAVAKVVTLGDVFYHPNQKKSAQQRAREIQHFLEDQYICYQDMLIDIKKQIDKLEAEWSKLFKQRKESDPTEVKIMVYNTSVQLRDNIAWLRDMQDNLGTAVEAMKVKLEALHASGR